MPRLSETFALILVEDTKTDLAGWRRVRDLLLAGGMREAPEFEVENSRVFRSPSVPRAAMPPAATPLAAATAAASAAAASVAAAGRRLLADMRIECVLSHANPVERMLLPTLLRINPGLSDPPRAPKVFVEILPSHAPSAHEPPTSRGALARGASGGGGGHGDDSAGDAARAAKMDGVAEEDSGAAVVTWVPSGGHSRVTSAPIKHAPIKHASINHAPINPLSVTQSLEYCFGWRGVRASLRPGLTARSTSMFVATLLAQATGRLGSDPRRAPLDTTRSAPPATASIGVASIDFMAVRSEAAALAVARGVAQQRAELRGVESFFLDWRRGVGSGVGDARGAPERSAAIWGAHATWTRCVACGLASRRPPNGSSLVYDRRMAARKFTHRFYSAAGLCALAGSGSTQRKESFGKTATNCFARPCVHGRPGYCESFCTLGDACDGLIK